MVTDFYLLDNSFISFIYGQKNIIIGGIFLGVSIFSYFYKRKKRQIEIFELRKLEKYYEILTINLILVMADSERFSIKEMLSNLSDDFKIFKSEMRAEIKELVSEFHHYKQSNNDRIAKLEGDQKVTTKTILMYVAFFGGFVMLAIQTYMSLTGK